jgi:hypothetical protein
VICVLCSVHVLHHIYWFAYVEQYSHPWNEKNLFIVYDPVFQFRLFTISCSDYDAFRNQNTPPQGHVIF